MGQVFAVTDGATAAGSTALYTVPAGTLLYIEQLTLAVDSAAGAPAGALLQFIGIGANLFVLQPNKLPVFQYSFRTPLVVLPGTAILLNWAGMTAGDLSIGSLSGYTL